MAFCHSSLFAISTCFQWISALILCVLLLRRVDAQNRSDEVRALLDFRYSGGGFQWNPNSAFEGYWSTWNENAENACAWTGVVCSSNFTVVELDLSGWGIGPLFFQPLARLRDLRILDLSSSFLGMIPDDIGSLTELVRLDLSVNIMYGYSIPPNISNCKSLQYIYLEQNQLSGEIPSLSELKNLKILNLADNLLTGPFPKDLTELSSLVRIDLGHNLLNGSIPSLPKLINLEDLRLDDNNFTKFQESWLPPPNIASLLVSGNLLDGMIPPSIATLKLLESLNMSRNQLSSAPFGLSYLFQSSYARSQNGVQNAFWLDLSQNQLTGNILERILPDSSPSWVVVNLSHNNFTGRIPLDGEKVQYYNVLDLSYNQLSGPVPSLLNNSNSIIWSLQLQNNNLSGDIVESLFSATSISQFLILDEVNLQNNLFTGDLSRMACTTLNGREDLNISNNNITVLYDGIEILDISNNNLQMTTTETNPHPLTATLECFMQCQYLNEIRMAGNNFSGATLPTQFTNVTGLLSIAILDLSSSHLKGEILDTSFNSTGFPSLQLLNLSNNDLIGLVPKNIVKLPNLTTLDVANNRLSGPLPTILPTSSLYNPSFFAGNGVLCGDPLPPCKDNKKIGVLWWQLLIIVGGSTIVAVGSCLVATWRWRVYHKRHQQDADLIKTLMDRESATLMGLHELKKATDNFADSAQIGEGGFGTVYIGKLNDGTRVAIKRSKREGSEEDKKQFLNEVRILSQVNHRHLVKLLGCCMENKVALLVFEYVSNGTLQEHLQGKSRGAHMSWSQRLNIVVQTADALNYLHLGATFPIYHRDVKSANILLADNLNVKVADFGISKLAPVEATHMSTIAVQGTMGYIDPEYYTSYHFTDKSDVYSFGVLILEVISAKPALDFQRGGDETSLVNFAKPCIESGDLHQLIDPALEETYNDPNGRSSMLHAGKLAMRCLNMRATARPSMNEVLAELKALLLQLDGTSEDLNSINKDHGAKDSQRDGATAIEMSEFSRTEFEILLNPVSKTESCIVSPSNSSMVQGSIKINVAGTF